jgi:hypothetical protein
VTRIIDASTFCTASTLGLGRWKRGGRFRQVRRHHHQQQQHQHQHHRHHQRGGAEGLATF